MSAFGAEAQTAPSTLGRIKAAKAINVAFAGDSLPFSFVNTLVPVAIGRKGVNGR